MHPLVTKYPLWVASAASLLLLAWALGPASVHVLADWRVAFGMGHAWAWEVLLLNGIGIHYMVCQAVAGSYTSRIYPPSQRSRLCLVSCLPYAEKETAAYIACQ